MQSDMQEMLSYTLDNLKIAIEKENIVSKPVYLEDGSTLIPISKISVGFASGGGEYGMTKRELETQFAGGGGGGMTIMPLGVVICKSGDHNYIQITEKEKDNKWMDLIISGLNAIKPRKK